MLNDQQTYKRATTAAGIGFGVQLFVALMLLLLGSWSMEPVVKLVMWYAFGGLGIWVCLWIVYKQHALERAEALEAEQLSKTHGTNEGIFASTLDDLSVARKRLDTLYKWFIPLFSVFTSLYLILLGIGGLAQFGFLEWALSYQRPVETQHILPMLGFLSGMALFGFLVSRYMAGMGKTPAWSMLNAGAGYLMGAVLMMVLMVVAYIAAYSDAHGLMWIMFKIISGLMIVIGIEVFLTFILDFYRPRKAGEIVRPAFDSRFLSLLTSPESIAKTINEAINYQFGFEITRSWFWQLLTRVAGGLLIFAILIMMLISCVVVVDTNQQAVVTRFGKLVGEPLTEGISFKLPWPISSVDYYDITTIRTLPIGSTEAIREDVKAILWTNEHGTGVPEYLIVALPTNVDLESDENLLPIALVEAQVSLNYRIRKDGLMDYLTTTTDPDGMVKAIASQHMSRYLYRKDIDTWIGGGASNAVQELRQLIQAEVDQRKLGIEVTSVDILSIHPPQEHEVAAKFHEVIGAEKQKQTMIGRAEQEAVKIQSKTGGSVKNVEQILKAYEELKTLQSQNADEKTLAAKTLEVEKLIRDGGGDAGQVIAEARAYRWERENRERGRAERFIKQLLAFEASPKLYKMRRYLEVLAEGLSGARKYMIVADRAKLVLRGDFKEAGGSPVLTAPPAP